MALFNSTNKEDKKAAKVAALLEKYNLQDLSDPRDIENVKNIANDLMGNKMIELGTALSGSGEDVAKLIYLHALVEQNWIIIRKLDQLTK